MEATPRGRIFFWPTGVMFVGWDITNEMHEHFTASLNYALEGTFRVRADGAPQWGEYRGVLVAPGVQQQMDGSGARVVIMQVDPETEDYARLAHRFEQGSFCELSDETCDRLAKQAGVLLEEEEFHPDALWGASIGALAGESRRKIDPRIQRVLDTLKRKLADPPTAAELAASVDLSEGRLIHLFTEQMGVPIRRYVLWLRMRDVMFSLAFGRSMTQAAHAAGFSDSAHMTRTFRTMFGLRPSLLVKRAKDVSLDFVRENLIGDSGPHHAADLERWGELIERRGRGG